jgi:hypothetical protein
MLNPPGASVEVKKEKNKSKNYINMYQYINMFFFRTRARAICSRKEKKIYENIQLDQR